MKKTKRGFLLMNTGSPDEPTEHAMRIYLKEVLTDDEADQPPLLRTLMRNSPMHPHETAKMAEAYRAIWTENGAPLVHHSILLAAGLRAKLDDPLEVGMSFGRPSYKDAVEKLLYQEVDEICLIPMFPQYAMSTFGLCVNEVKAELKRQKTSVKLRVTPPFFEDPAYLETLTESIRDTEEHVLFSYHGYPNRHLQKAQRVEGGEHRYHHCLTSLTCCSESSAVHDTCYRHQCLKTSRAAARAAHIPDGQYSSAFQSRHSRKNRMSPFTDETLMNLPRKGVKKLAVVCPSFYCDDLETLDEISNHGKEVFMKAGGESYRTIPCPNHSESSLHCMEELIHQADHWPLAEV